MRSTSTNPLIDGLKADVTSGAPKLVPNEKGGLEWDRVGRDAAPKILEFWYQAVRGADGQFINEKLTEAYKADPPLTLKAIFQVRDIRGGKGERKLGRQCFLWLAKNHPKTLVQNFWAVVEMGRWDDFYCLQTVVDVWPEVLEYISGTVASELPNALFAIQGIANDDEDHRQADAQRLLKNLAEFGITVPDEVRPKGKSSLIGKWLPNRANTKFSQALVKALAVSICKACTGKKVKKRNHLYRLFLSTLRMPMELVETALASGNADKINFNKIPGQAMRRYGRTCGDKECKGLEADPSCKKCKALIRQDRDRFQEFLDKLKEQRLKPKKESEDDEEEVVKVNARTLHLHEITKGYGISCDMRYNEDTTRTAVDEILEAMWFTIQESLDPEVLADVLFMLDASGSMNGLPFQAGSAIGLMGCTTIPEDNPFHRCLITFTDMPDFHEVKGDTLLEMVRSVGNMRVGYSTKFRLAVELPLRKLLELERTTELTKEELIEFMPKAIVVLTDGQWDAFDRGYKSGLEYAAELYRKNGFPFPHIILWNLRQTDSYPTTTNDGIHCTMISGFSVEIMNAILSGKDFSPAAAMLRVLNVERYAKLKVID